MSLGQVDMEPKAWNYGQPQRFWLLLAGLIALLFLATFGLFWLAAKEKEQMTTNQGLRAQVRAAPKTIYTCWSCYNVKLNRFTMLVDGYRSHRIRT